MIVLPSISFADFLTQADVCDVVLWSGSSLDSSGVEILSMSEFSHASMVIVDPATGEKCLLQSVTESLEPDPLAGGKSHPGVQAGDLQATMTTVAAYGDFPTWRPYSAPNRTDPAFVKAVWDLAKTLDGIPFPSVPFGMAKLLIEGRYEGIEKTNPLYCSALVGLMFKRLGIIDKKTPCNAYFPKDFSSRYPGMLAVEHGSFGDDMLVEMS